MNIHFDQQVQSPNRIGGMNVHYPPAKRMGMRWRWFVVVMLALSPLLFILYRVFFEVTIIESVGRVIAHDVAVIAPSSSTISGLYVKNGDSVRKGAPLAVLIDPQAQARRSLTEQEHSALSANTGNALEGALQLALSIEQRMASELAKRRRLMHVGAATAAEVAEAEGRLDAARRDVLRAREDMRTSSIRILRTEQEMLVPLGQKEGLTLVSPIDGQVLAVRTVVGASVMQGASLLTLVAMEDISIIAYVQEKDVEPILAKGTAEIRFHTDALSVPCRVSMWPQVTDVPSSRRAHDDPLVPLLLTPEKNLPQQYAVNGLPCTVFFGVRNPLGKMFF